MGDYDSGRYDPNPHNRVGSGSREFQEGINEAIRAQARREEQTQKQIQENIGLIFDPILTAQKNRREPSQDTTQESPRETPVASSWWGIGAFAGAGALVLHSLFTPAVSDYNKITGQKNTSPAPTATTPQRPVPQQQAAPAIQKQPPPLTKIVPAKVQSRTPVVPVEVAPVVPVEVPSVANPVAARNMYDLQLSQFFNTHMHAIRLPVTDIQYISGRLSEGLVSKPLDQHRRHSLTENVTGAMYAITSAPIAENGSVKSIICATNGSHVVAFAEASSHYIQGKMETSVSKNLMIYNGAHGRSLTRQAVRMRDCDQAFNNLGRAYGLEEVGLR